MQGSATAGAAPAAAPQRLLHGAAFLALFCVGLYASAFGPAIPFIAGGLGVSLDTAGLLLTVFFAGSISASAAVAVALHARSSRLLGASGLAAVAAGSLLLGWAPSWALALAGGVVLGTGDGLIIAGLHILMARSSRDVPKAVNDLNLYFALGAVAGPIWAGGVLSATDERGAVYAGIAAVALAAMLGLLLADEPVAPAGAPADAAEQFRLPDNPVTFVMGGLLFLYVGAEFGLGSWVSTYAKQSAHAGVLVAALLTSGFWLALAIGRLLTGAYFRRRRDGLPLLIASAAGAGIASLALALTSGNIAVSAACALGAGLFMGPMWPTTVAIASESGGPHDTAAAVTMGNAGGLAVPWLQGKILVGAGPAQGVAVTAALSGLMFAGASAFRLRRGRLE
ncbi:MAG: MFS transporter [Dehalococcoidia bacterium]|nr:MFS transporter [Dehalococcoidia bacterium]